MIIGQESTKDCLIYSLELSSYELETNSLNHSNIKIWKPKLGFPMYCKRFPIKYILFWFYHYFGVFKNTNYQAVMSVSDDRVDAALMVVPKYNRWPFMSNEDVQLIYVVTHPEMLRKGLARLIIRHTIETMAATNFVKRIWYVTTEDNIPSQRLCESLGFKLTGYGYRSIKWGFFKRLKLIPI